MTEVDQRVNIAREYLATAEQTDVLHLAPTALLRECAESRRQLKAVLDAYADQVDAAGRLDAARQLTQIREVLAHFDWEFHDRQLALEEIHRHAREPGSTMTLPPRATRGHARAPARDTAWHGSIARLP